MRFELPSLPNQHPEPAVVHAEHHTKPESARAQIEGDNMTCADEFLSYMEPVRARFHNPMVALAAEAHAMATRSGPK